MEQKFYQIKQILNPESFTGKDGMTITSQEVIVEEQQNVQFPDSYVLRFNEKTMPQLKNFAEGDIVKAWFGAKASTFTTKDGRTGTRQTHPCWKMELVQKAVF